MDYREISKLINYNEKESSLYMPNEIFTNLKASISKTPHIAFAYSFVYFITFLYAKAKHFNVDEIIDNSKIKEVLGYSPTNQSLDYLIKKNGLLDEIGYTESVRDYPVSWQFNVAVDESVSFFMSSEVDSLSAKYLPDVPKRFFLKYPVKAFSRIGVDNEGEYEIAGTFYDVGNTHNIPFEVFLYCMSNEKIGCTGFYLYSYLKHKNDIFTNGYDASLDRLSSDTGITRRSLNSYLGSLKSYKMIDLRYNQEFFVAGLAKEDRRANTYTTRDHEFFSDKPVPFKRIGFKSNEEYMKQKEAKNEISAYVESQLPF